MFPAVAPLLPIDQNTVGDVAVTRILVVDNYDSFVYTIVGYLNQLGAQTDVLRNDDPALTALLADGLERYDGVLVSPGPGTPSGAGASMPAIEACAQTGTPMLGRLPGSPGARRGLRRNGRALPRADARQDVTGLARRHRCLRRAARRRSPPPATTRSPCSPRPSPTCCVVTATTGNGIVMGLQHRELPLFGVQFHPESVLTEGGHRLLANWLAACGDVDAVDAVGGPGALGLPLTPPTIR